MKEYNLGQFWRFGAIHWYLVRLPSRSKKIGENGTFSAIEFLRQSLKEHNLKVTYNAGRELWEFAKKLNKETQDPSELMSDEETKKVSTLAKQLEITLFAEAESISVFRVGEKRYDTEKLMSASSDLLAENVWEKMPAICLQDWSAGCKCIAFSLSTAGAFHLLRCVEGTLRQYYLSIIKQKRLRENKRMWGSMIGELKKRTHKKPPPELLDTLDNIRVNYRNPTNHPEKQYDIDEVQDLLGLCVDAINRMTKSKHWEEPEDSHSYLAKQMT